MACRASWSRVRACHQLRLQARAHRHLRVLRHLHPQLHLPTLAFPATAGITASPAVPHADPAPHAPMPSYADGPDNQHRSRHMYAGSSDLTGMQLPSTPNMGPATVPQSVTNPHTAHTAPAAGPKSMIERGHLWQHYANTRAVLVNADRARSSSRKRKAGAAVGLVQVQPHVYVHHVCTAVHASRSRSLVNRRMLHEGSVLRLQIVPSNCN